MRDGRLTYSREFLLSLSDCRSRPSSFPSSLPPEILATAKTAPPIVTPQRKGSAERGAAWDKQQQPGLSSLPVTRRALSSVGPSYPPGMTPSGSGGAQDVRAHHRGAAATPSSRDRGGAVGVRFESQPPLRQDRLSRSNSGNLKELTRDGRQPSSSGKDRDGRDGRDRGGGRGGMSAPSLPPVAPLSKTASRWEPGKGGSTEMDGIKKKVLALLNKLTIDKFDVITDRLIELIRANCQLGPGLLEEVVSILFDKALDESYFSGMYSDLCVKISTDVADLFEDPVTAAAAAAASAAGAPPTPTAAPPATPSSAVAAAAAGEEKAVKKKSLFRVILLNACQSAFARGVESVSKEGRSPEEVAELEGAQKRRMLGNIRFIGELYKKAMIVEKIMHTCVVHLLGALQEVQEEDIEALCNLLTTIGKKLDHKRAEAHMDSYFDRLEDILRTARLSSRIRFMILDLLDLRKNRWMPRTKKQEAKSREQVRQESEQEAIAKAGGGRGGLPQPSPTGAGGMGRGNNVSALGAPRISMPSAGGHSKSQQQSGAQDVRILSSSATPLTTTVTSGAAAKTAKDGRASVGAAAAATAAPLLAPAGGNPRAASPSNQLGPGSSLRPVGALAPQGTRKQLQLSRRSVGAESSAAATAAPTTTTPPSASPTDTSDAASLPRSMSSTAVSAVAAGTEETAELDKSVRNILKEYAAGREWSEIVVLVQEQLQAGGHEHLLMQHALDLYINDRRCQEGMSELLKLLVEKRMLQPADIDRGTRRCLRLLTAEFIEDDCPAAPRLIAAMLRPLFPQGVLGLKAVADSVGHLMESGYASKIFSQLFRDLLTLQDGVDLQAVCGMAELASFSLPSVYADQQELLRDMTSADSALLRQLFPLASFQSSLHELLQKAFTPSASSYEASVDPFVLLLVPHSAAASSPVFLRSLYRAVLEQAQLANIEPDNTKLFSSLIAPAFRQLAATPSLSAFAQSPAALREAHASLVQASFTFSLSQSAPSPAALFARLLSCLDEHRVVTEAKELLSEWREETAKQPWLADKDRETAFDAATALLK